MKIPIRSICTSVLAVMFAICNICSIYAQEKIEAEKKIDQKEVPEAAMNWLQSAFDEMNRLKWYEQLSNGQRKYEAKFKHEGQRYSVEFDTLGIISNVEITISIKELEQDVRQLIESYLNEDYDKWKLRKLQIQYTGSQDAWRNYIADLTTDLLVIKYELEYYGKKGKDKDLWEGVFDQSGNFVSKRRIVIKSAVNLNF